MSGPKLEYFYYDSCPFCQRVLGTINDLKVAVEFCDILSNNEHLNRLVQDTGRQTVPCLYINNKPMHESLDIMNWLEENVDKLQKNP